MSFVVSPDAYGRYMGRYAEPLATVFGAFAGIAAAPVSPAASFVGAVGASAEPQAASGWQSAITQPYIKAERHPAVFISKGFLLDRRLTSFAGPGDRRP